MTEDQIERKAERAMDYLDRQFMAGVYSQAEYDRKVKELDAWSEGQWKRLDHVTARAMGSV